MIIRIKKIAFEACFNIGNYENEKIRFEAQVDEGDSPEEIIEALREKAVKCAQPDSNQAWNERYKLQKEIDQLQKACQQWREKWEATAEFLKTQGIRPDCPEMPSFLNAIAPSLITEEVITGEMDDQPF